MRWWDDEKFKDGRIMDVGTPLEVYNNPSNMFVAGLIGSPAMNFFPGGVEIDGSGLFFANREMKLRIPDRFKAGYEGACGWNVCLGIRPQSIHDAMLAEWTPGMERVKTRVKLVEPLGNEVILLLSNGKETFRAVVDPHTGASSNTAMEVLFDMNKMYLFDVETETVIRQELPRPQEAS
jgi:multiple sugar transport system ATP-binding protein